jgi:hypothetical protein
MAHISLNGINRLVFLKKHVFFYLERETALLGAFANLRKATISFVMSVRPSAGNNSAPTERISIKFDI